MPICMMEESGALLIRAVQGHSVKLVQEDELLDILTADQVDLPEQCVHGTYYRHLDIGTQKTTPTPTQLGFHGPGPRWV